MTNPKITEILEAFEPYDSVYKREAVDAAIEFKEEITPYLIDILKEVLANPQRYIDDYSDNMAYIYAFVLLGYFKETGAHQTIVDLFSLPGELIDPLFGDLITEDLGTVLFKTCGGSVEQIKALIANKDAYEYCRGSAARALTYAVIEGHASREEALDFLGSLFTGDESDDPDDIFWALIADDVCNLYPEEKMDIIEQAFQNDLIDPTFIGPESFEKVLEDGKEKTLEDLRRKMQRKSLDDVHEYMSWWAMFNPERQHSPPTPTPVQPAPKPSTSDASKTAKTLTPKLPSLPKSPSKKQKRAKKKKRKAARASRKKNRRR